ncbi:MAG: hypothetical protein DDT29_02225 [Dehalococcoidia bacterium]|nr:hypothetical protein [Bacillota bacterium]
MPNARSAAQKLGRFSEKKNILADSKKGCIPYIFPKSTRDRKLLYSQGLRLFFSSFAVKVRLITHYETHVK